MGQTVKRDYKPTDDGTDQSSRGIIKTLLSSHDRRLFWESLDQNNAATQIGLHKSISPRSTTGVAIVLWGIDL